MTGSLTLTICFSVLFQYRTLTCSLATTVTWAPLRVFMSTNWRVLTVTPYTRNRSSGRAWWRLQVRSGWCCTAVGKNNRCPNNLFAFVCVVQVVQLIMSLLRYLASLPIPVSAYMECCTNHTTWNQAKNTPQSCLCTAAHRLVWLKSITIDFFENCPLRFSNSFTQNVNSDICFVPLAGSFKAPK